ncbi:voltage-gated chloride channel protein [Niastella koreensis]|uniref:Cl-channel voltage-gated family protein n=2 Tax=Niastella koreensis TaxID=354356 RepID=G8TPI6_NIAKG|nr:voltage-gated chloride channel family protein [Niastella koreensis]AEV97807.1 Cl- channel voltage-gated family protein [Niastella koreensis GR20-10]OQP40383.1 voltage-gated chloride channel protein [Niastella koreensis]
MIKKLNNRFEHLSILNHLLRWTLLTTPVSFIVGSLVALFLWLLEKATETRWQHDWLLYLLPLAGILIYAVYKYLGKNAEAGNNLIMEEIHEPGGGVPTRMTPLVLATTIITHLFGGSAGREGTAVQMGGSMAALLGRWFKLNQQDLSILLMCGIAAGFGAVFGTPVTGALFALEVLTIGRINYKALLPCFMASVLADFTCSAYGIHHTAYHITFKSVAASNISFLHFDYLLLAKVILAGVLFGLAGYLFSELSHTIKNYSNRFIKIKWLIPVIGGIIIIGLTFALGTRDYLGLGVTNPDPDGVSIVSAFTPGGATYFSWFWKILFTAITLGMGFKGGEVTPLFFIGATLGNTIAVLTGAPVDLMAGLGFIAVFAGATNTPIACTIMGVELFGGDYILYYAIACFTAYYFSGHTGIYLSQRIGLSKTQEGDATTNTTLKQIREKRISKRKFF